MYNTAKFFSDCTASRSEKVRALAMGRKKVEMKKIKSKNSRHVTFSKRRKGLMKKASELSVLCDVEVALIVFSGSGNLYEFSSSGSLGKTLERYQTYNASQEVALIKKAEKRKKHHTEYSGHRKVDEHLNVMSDLKVEQLTTQELIHLERDVGDTLAQTRQSKANNHGQRPNNMHVSF
ncbi:MADS-box transcription factor 34 isoform X2 [Morus notabilis]|uniref:MADS-box transcription factor 34 isoform X2 n=1 Tax=Morus notabilis TaxID=981085 RepID=UPI000CED6834|nr:MADS-box transcription factor 34 isoform X2 [Morus notabilis]